MLTDAQVVGFLVAAVLVTLSPGPDNLLVLSMGMSKGRRRGIVFGLGCAMGCIGHTALAVAGVSAIIAASPAAFMALKMAGGGYLLYLGYGALRSHNAAKVQDTARAEKTYSALFFQGVVANVINPKVALFFLSFLPQFVVLGNGAANVQMAALGVIFTLQAGVIFSLLGYFSGTIGGWLNRTPKAGVWLDRIAGVVFVGLGLRLIFAQ
jgi:threonine/homoserine/homoserine lactone efflux protein